MAPDSANFLGLEGVQEEKGETVYMVTHISGNWAAVKLAEAAATMVTTVIILPARWTVSTSTLKGKSKILSSPWLVEIGVLGILTPVVALFRFPEDQFYSFFHGTLRYVEKAGHL